MLGYQRVPHRSDEWREITASGAPTAAAPPAWRRLRARLTAAGGWAALTHTARQTFMPAQYPASVAPPFLRYCQWQFVQMAAGSASGVLSMQALLFAAGLGAGAIPMAAAVNWVLKDGIGQLGGVLYAAVFGAQFDEDPKRQRFRATATLQLATLLEVVTPLVPALFLPLASLANIGKNVAILTISATRAQMHQRCRPRPRRGGLPALP